MKCLCAHVSVLTCLAQSVSFDRVRCKHRICTLIQAYRCVASLSAHTHVPTQTASTWVGTFDHRQSSFSQDDQVKQVNKQLSGGVDSI